MKTDIELRLIENSKEFKNFIKLCNKSYDKSQKLEKIYINKLNKNLPYYTIKDEMNNEKRKSNDYLSQALKMLKD